MRVLPKVGSSGGGGPRKLLGCFHLGGGIGRGFGGYVSELEGT